jgi:hypothetical protein
LDIRHKYVDILEEILERAPHEVSAEYQQEMMEAALGGGVRTRNLVSVAAAV